MQQNIELIYGLAFLVGSDQVMVPHVLHVWGVKGVPASPTCGVGWAAVTMRYHKYRGVLHGGVLQLTTMMMISISL